MKQEKRKPMWQKWCMEWIKIDFESQEVISRKSMIKEYLTTFNLSVGVFQKVNFWKLRSTL